MTISVPAATALLRSLVTTGPTHDTQAAPTETTTPTPIPDTQFAQTVIWYVDLLNFDTMASNPNLSLVGMENLRSEACAASLREEHDADIVYARVQDRLAIWEGVVGRLEERIKKLLDEGGQ